MRRLDPAQAAAFRKTRHPAAWAARAWIFEHFGYDLNRPTNIAAGTPCFFSDETPPSPQLWDAWPAWPLAPSPFDQAATGRPSADAYHCRRFREPGAVARPRLLPGDLMTTRGVR